jgi:hypothetical protein
MKKAEISEKNYPYEFGPIAGIPIIPAEFQRSQCVISIKIAGNSEISAEWNVPLRWKI